MQLLDTLVAAKLAPGASEGPFNLENVQLATQVQQVVRPQRAAAAKQRNYAELGGGADDADDGESDAYEEEEDEEADAQEDEVYAFCCSCFNSVAH